MRGTPQRARRLLVLALTALISLALLTPTLSPAQTASDSAGGTTSAVTTAPLNLRSGPGPDQPVITVMPAGATVSITGNAQSGFYPVSYNGTNGWASVDFLRVSGGNPGVAPATGTARTTAPLNFRSGPSTADRVIAVIPAGTTISLTGQSANGFLSASYNGANGWAYAQFLDTGGSTPPPAPTPAPTPDPAPTGTAQVTTALNLRAGPSTSDRSLMVMPAGATVSLTGQSANGFLSVTYNGVSGWAYGQFLSTSGAPAPSTPPAPAPDPSASWQAVTTAGLNLRSNPNMSATVLLVIPAGATVTVTGGGQNGFLPVSYSGRTGWASANYLREAGNPGTAPTPPAPGGGGSGIVWPVRGGTWQVIQGYNGGTHQNRSASAQYYYALDIARVDGGTAGQSVYAPASGIVRWVDPGSGGIAIDMGNGYAVVMFHFTADSGIGRGQNVQQGQYLGTISGPGGNGYASTPHIEIDVWQSSDGVRTRRSVPFTGGNAISGMSFPDIGGSNQHNGTRFNP